MRKLFLLPVVLFGALLIVTQLPTQQAEASFNPCVIIPQLCQPSATATPSPTPTPTVMPCYTEEVNVFSFVNNKDKDKDKKKHKPCATPTPTPGVSEEPTASPSAVVTETTTVAGPTATPGPAVCSIAIDAPILQGVNRNSDTAVTFSWWPIKDGADRYAIIYGYSADKLDFGTNSIGGTQTSVQLNSLAPNAAIFAQITAYKGACSSTSGVLGSEANVPLGAPATGRAK